VAPGRQKPLQGLGQARGEGQVLSRATTTPPSTSSHRRPVPRRR
jgi:hypothetical protein